MEDVATNCKKNKENVAKKVKEICESIWEKSEEAAHMKKN